MAKKPFEVGDRVRVYWRGGTDHDGGQSLSNQAYEPAKATITAVFKEGLRILYDDGRTDNSLAHPKQCRRLLAKKPRERVWLHCFTNGIKETLDVAHPSLKQPCAYCKEFVEVRKKQAEVANGAQKE